MKIEELEIHPLAQAALRYFTVPQAAEASQLTPDQVIEHLGRAMVSLRLVMVLNLTVVGRRSWPLPAGAWFRSKTSVSSDNASSRTGRFVFFFSSASKPGMASSG